MKILTININKGGTGKTTLSHNLAEYLAKDNRVLDVDENILLENGLLKIMKN